MFTWALVLAPVVSPRGQSPAPKPHAPAGRLHWQKYVNFQHGFSFWYPDVYKPVPLPPLKGEVSNYAGDSVLLLRRWDNPHATIWVGVSPDPFHLYPGAGDLMPTRQMVRHHVFYSGVGGSMGVGFTDFYDLNLKGKTLMFVFGPDDGVNPNEETKQLEPKLLKTFRTF